MIRLAVAAGIDFASRTLAGLVVALPFASALAATGIGRFPGGDRLLWEPGGLVLTEVARLLEPAAVPVLSASVPLFVGFAVLLHLPLALVLVLLADARPFEAARFLGRSLARVPALLLLSGVALLAQVLVVILAGSLGNALRGSLSNTTPWLPDAAFGAALLAGVLLALGIGVARDLARAAVAARDCDGRTALVEGLSTLRRAPLRALGTSAACAAGAAALAISVAVVVGRLDVGKPESYRFAFVILLHQLCLAGIALLRVRWFRTALELDGASGSQDYVP